MTVLCKRYRTKLVWIHCCNSFARRFRGFILPARFAWLFLLFLIRGFLSASCPCPGETLLCRLLSLSPRTRQPPDRVFLDVWHPARRQQLPRLLDRVRLRRNRPVGR